MVVDITFTNNEVVTVDDIVVNNQVLSNIIVDFFSLLLLIRLPSLMAIPFLYNVYDYDNDENEDDNNIIVDEYSVVIE